MESKIECDPKVQDVLSRLRFLSKIDNHEKLDVASLSLVADTWYNNFYRLIKSMAASKGICWCNMESRKISLAFIKSTTDEALKLAKNLLHAGNRSSEFNTSLGKMIITTLNELTPGIKGLKKTYASDRMFIAEIKTFQDILQAQIADLQRQLPPTPPPSPSTLRVSSEVRRFESMNDEDN